MKSRFIPEHDQAIKPQNLGPWLMKSSQSNFDLRAPSSYLARSYLIATVTKMGRKIQEFTTSCQILAIINPRFLFLGTLLCLKKKFLSVEKEIFEGSE